MLIKIPLKYLFHLVACLLFLFYLVQSFAQSQSYPFKQFPLPNDLPPIIMLYEDHLGFIWLGTAEGLYRYDGINYTFYSGDDPVNGLGREVIHSILEDNHHQLWIGARTGLYRYNSVKKDFEKFSGGDELYPYYLHQENDSCLLVYSIKGIYLFYPASLRWDKLDVGLKDNEIFAVQKGQGDDLWVGTNFFVRKYNFRNGTSQDYNLPIPSIAQREEKITVSQMFLDSRAVLWINTWHKGVFKLDTKTGVFETVGITKSNNENYLLGIYNPSMTEDAEGNVWLASEGIGINIYHPSTETITHIPKGTDYASGLTGTYFFIMADKEKNMWVKSERALHYLSRKSPIPKLKTEPGLIIPDALFIKLIEPGYALAGTFFGLYGINLETGHTTILNSTIQLPSVHNAEFQSTSDILINHDQTIWLTTPQGLRKVKYVKDENIDPEFSLIKIFPTRPSFWPSRIIPLNDSIIIVKGRSNTQVFATFNTNRGIYDYHLLPDSMLINSALMYKGDTLILCIRNKGLYYYHLQDRSTVFIPFKNRGKDLNIEKPVFLNITLLQNGLIALCTENYGVLIFDPNAKSFYQIDIAPLSNTNIAFSADEDEQHNLWIQSSNQLLYYDMSTKVLSKINLANSFKGNNPAYFIDKGKEMYCTFEGGLYHISLDQLLTKTDHPKLYLQTISARDHQLDWSDSDRINLGYSDNFLTYEFIGLDYENPQGISYWYKIPEIVDQWISLNNRTSLSFGRLAPGTYNLSLKASNDAGLWSEVINAPEIKITPPFWKSWWFIVIILATSASIVVYFQKLKRKKEEGELNLRNQIARDLHDDIGSTLSGIKIFSSIASDMAKGNTELSPILSQINDKSDTMMQSMSDIVWSINPAHDSLHDMMIRLKQYMSEVLEIQNIDVTYSTQVDLKHYKIDLRHRKELYLTLKEIINNAAKHSDCSHFNLNISKQKGEIVFSIEDDGIGMDENNISLGNGLKNIEARISQVGGLVKRESSPGKGTRYEIKMNIQ